MKPSDRIRELSKRDLPGEWATDDCDPRAIVAFLDEQYEADQKWREGCSATVGELVKAADEAVGTLKQMQSHSEWEAWAMRNAVPKPITREDVERVAEWVLEKGSAEEAASSNASFWLLELADREFGK